MIQTAPIYSVLATRLPGRRAIITGAAAGLGEALARLLARDKWTLCLVDQDAPQLLVLTGELNNGGSTAVALPIDVTDSSSLEVGIRTFCNTYGGVDLLITSAGVGLGGPADVFSAENWRKLFDVNVIAVGCAMAAVLPHMKAAGSGHIVNVASAAAYHCLPWLGSYSASKAAVVALTENLVAELHGTGVGASVMICTFFKSSMPKYAMGGPLAAKRTAGMMALAELTSEQTAAETLRGIEKGNVYILVGSQAQSIYRLKRYFPKLWLRLAPGVARKAFAKADVIQSTR